MAPKPATNLKKSKWRFFAPSLTLLALSLLLFFLSQQSGDIFKSQLLPNDTVVPQVVSLTVTPNPIAQGASLRLQGTLSDNTSLKDVVFFFTNQNPAEIELSEYGTFPVCSNNLIAFSCYKVLTGPFSNPYNFDVSYTLPQGTGTRYVVLALTDNANNLGGDFRAFEVVTSTSTTSISKLETSPSNVPKNSTFFVNAKALGPNNLYWFLIFSKQPINALEELSGIEECGKDAMGTHQLPGAKPNCYLWSGENATSKNVDLSLPFLVAANETSTSYQVYLLVTPNLNDLNQYVTQQNSFQIRAAAMPANTLTTIGAGTATFMGTSNCPASNPACIAIGKMHEKTKVSGVLQDFQGDTLNNNLGKIKQVTEGLQQSNITNPLKIDKAYAQSTNPNGDTPKPLFFNDSRRANGPTGLSYVGQWEERNDMPWAIPEQSPPATINDHLRAQINIYNNSADTKKLIVGMVVPEITGIYPAGRDFKSESNPFSSAGIYQLGVSSGYLTLPSRLPSWQIRDYDWCYNLQDMLSAKPGANVSKARAIENPTDNKLYQLMESPPDITGLNLGPGATTCTKYLGTPNFNTNMLDLSYDSSAALFLEQIQYFEIPAGGSVTFNYDKQLYESFYGQYSLYMAVEDGGDYYLVNKFGPDGVENVVDQPINSAFFRVIDLRFKPYGALTQSGNDGSVSGWAYDIDDYGKTKNTQILVVYFKADNPSLLDPIALFSGSIALQDVAMAYNSNWQSVKATATGTTPDDLRVPGDITNINYSYVPSAATITTLYTSAQGMNFFVPNSNYLATVWAIDNEDAFSMIGYKNFTYSGGSGDVCHIQASSTTNPLEVKFVMETAAGEPGSYDQWKLSPGEGQAQAAKQAYPVPQESRYTYSQAGTYTATLELFSNKQLTGPELPLGTCSTNVTVSGHQQGDHPPAFVADTFSMSGKDFLTNTTANLVVSAGFSDPAGKTDLKDATIYLLNEFHHLSDLSEAVAAAKVSMPACSTTSDLPCKQVMAATSQTDYITYTGTANFKPTTAGKKSLLIIAHDSQASEAYKLAAFDVTAQNPNNSAPQNVEGGYSLDPNNFKLNTPASTTLTVQFLDEDGADDLLQTTEAYFLDQWFHLSKLGDAIDYVNHISTDLPDCTAAGQLPCVANLSGSNIDETTKSYTGTVEFTPLETGDHSVLIIGKDTQGAKVNKLARFTVSTNGQVANTTPVIVASIAYPDGSPFPDGSVSETPITLKLSANITDQESNSIDNVQFLISRGEFELPDPNTVTTTCEQDGAGNIINVHANCYFFADPNDTLAALEAENLTDNPANNKSTPANYTRTVTFSEYAYYHFSVIGREILTEQTFNWFGNHVLGTALSLKLNPVSQKPVIGDVSLNLTVPLQDRDNNPKSDRNTHAGKVWLQVLNPAVNTPARVTSFQTNADGKATVALKDLPLGNSKITVKTDQHLSRMLTVNLVAGVNTVTFANLLGGDIAGSPHPTFTGTFDNIVNSIDIAELFANWGDKLGKAAYLRIHDLDGNGEVGAEDYSTLIANANRRGE